MTSISRRRANIAVWIVFATRTSAAAARAPAATSRPMERPPLTRRSVLMVSKAATVSRTPGWVSNWFDRDSTTWLLASLGCTLKLVGTSPGAVLSRSSS
jgi:hypothetical protein